MEITNFEKEKNMKIENKLINENEQKNFLETTLGKTINTAIDIGIRAILPDFIDEQIINVKNNLINYGLRDGIQESVSDAIDLGKSAIGIVTGNFENVSQMQQAVKSGGLIDGISSLLDNVIDKVRKAGLIDTTVARTIKQGKNVILNNIENNIETTFNKQYEAIEHIDKYINNWKSYFEEKDFSGMEKEYNKIRKQLKNIVPIEKTINNAKEVETLHELIKNNGHNFDLSQDQIELVKKLS